MNRLFWGLVFVLLDWKVKLGSAAVELLPDFVGFYMVMKGMESLSGESARFDRGRHLAFGLAVFSAVLFAADLMDPDTMTKVWLWVLGLAALVLTLVLVRMAVRGIRDMGRDTQRLDTMWMILAVLQSICYMFSWVPLVGSICGGVSVAVGLLFLAAMWSILKKSAE